MFRRRLASALTTALVVGALALAGAGPASAAPPMPARTVPADEVLVGLSCDWQLLPDMLHLYGLDPDSGAGALTGSTTRFGHSYFCGRALEWDRVPDSCSAYTLAQNPDLLAGLLRTDLTTGRSTLVAPLTAGGAVTPATGMVIDPSGVAWVLTPAGLNTVDLVTGVVTLVSPITGASIVHLAWDPSTGSLVGGSETGLYALDSTTGAATLILDLSAEVAGTFIEGFTVDSAGTFWLTVREPSTTGVIQEEWVSSLVSVSGGVAEVEGPVIVDGAKLSTMALASLSEQACDLPTLPLPVDDEVVVTLAATGIEDATPILLPVAGLVLAIGALLLNSARRAREAGARHRGSRRAAR